MIYLPKPKVNIFSSSPVSKSSFEEIKYKNLDLKNANNNKTVVFRPKVFLKISTVNPKKKESIKRTYNLISKRCFKIKNENIIGLK